MARSPASARSVEEGAGRGATAKISRMAGVWYSPSTCPGIGWPQSGHTPGTSYTQSRWTVGAEPSALSRCDHGPRRWAGGRPAQVCGGRGQTGSRPIGGLRSPRGERVVPRTGSRYTGATPATATACFVDCPDRVPASATRSAPGTAALIRQGADVPSDVCGRLPGSWTASSAARPRVSQTVATADAARPDADHPAPPRRAKPDTRGPGGPPPERHNGPRRSRSKIGEQHGPASGDEGT